VEPARFGSMAQLRRALELKEKIEALESELNGILGNSSEVPEASGPRRGKKRFSLATRRKMAAAQRARWGSNNEVATVKPARRRKRRRMSAAARALLSKRAKQRWKKAKAAGRSRL